MCERDTVGMTRSLSPGTPGMLLGAVTAVVMEEKSSWRKQLLGWMLWVDCSLEGRVSGEGQHRGCRGGGRDPGGGLGG